MHKSHAPSTTTTCRYRLHPLARPFIPAPPATTAVSADGHGVVGDGVDAARASSAGTRGGGGRATDGGRGRSIAACSGTAPSVRRLVLVTGPSPRHFNTFSLDDFHFFFQAYDAEDSSCHSPHVHVTDTDDMVSRPSFEHDNHGNQTK